MTMTSIRKRDGRVAPFDEEKIAGAIGKAFDATYKPGYGETAHKLADEVVSILELEGDRQPDVEHIQDLVERVLMDNGYVQTAKAYILYRDQRSKAREMNTRLMKIYEDITFTAARESDLKRENANIDGDTAMGSMLKFGSEGAKQFYDMFVLKPEHARAHREGDIHIHDLDFLTLTTTCCQIDIRKLFKGGFPQGTVPCGSPTTSPLTPPLRALPSSPIRTTSTADRRLPTLTTGWPMVCARPLCACTGKICPGGAAAGGR